MSSNSESCQYNPPDSNESKIPSSSNETKSDMVRKTSWRKENLAINTDLDSQDEGEILNQIKDFNIMKEFFSKELILIFNSSFGTY